MISICCEMPTRLMPIGPGGSSKTQQKEASLNQDSHKTPCPALDTATLPAKGSLAPGHRQGPP
jgi:hypothetical protein